jgi:hypothetical protein
MRLYICYNKDILGLDDCIYKDGISFITAKCLSSNACAFTIEKSILNEIKNKIPEIEGKINVIKEKRELVMIDRLMNIYNRIVQMNKKDKENDKSLMENSKKDTYKYINYLFGINQNQKSNEFKTFSSKTNKNMIQSALPLKKRKMINEVLSKDNTYNNNIAIANNTYIKDNIKDNVNNNLISNNHSKYNDYNSHRMMKYKSTENINDFNNNDEINNKIDIINYSEKKK